MEQEDRATEPSHDLLFTTTRFTIMHRLILWKEVCDRRQDLEMPSL